MVDQQQQLEQPIVTSATGVTASDKVRQQQTPESTQRMLSTLDAAEAGLAALELDHPEGVKTEPLRRTKLAVSVVIPVYNELQTIRQIAERVRATGYVTEVLIVDDCSTDGTRDELLELEKLEGVRVFMHGYNKGKGAAIHTALAHITGDVVLVQDADLEYNPTDYGRLLAPIEAGEADVVYGSRYLGDAKQDPSWLHRLGNAAITRLSNLATGLRLTDMESGYKVFRRAAIREMVLREKRFGFEPELTAKLARRKCRICEVPISYNYRGYDAGKKIQFRDAVRALYCIPRYRWWD